MRLFAVLLAVITATAQDLSFSQLPSTDPRPSARIDGTAAYDPTTQQLLVFGGQADTNKSDLWAYSLQSKTWKELQPAGSRPPGRFGHTTIFDPVRRRLIVFGGQAGGFFSDVWAYSVDTNRWQQLSQDDAGPNRRYGHSAIYDAARDRMVISHGFTDDGRFDDTWAFDLSSNSWRNLNPSGSKPLRRCLHHSAYDPVNNQMFLFGGCASGAGPCPLNDLWTLDLATNRWTERTGSVKPPARQWYSMAFDEGRRRLVIFGGSGRGLLGDTWEYDSSLNTWREVTPEGAPSARERAGAAYIPDLQAVAFFGGRTGSGTTNELWLLGPTAVSGTPEISDGGIVDAFSGRGGAVAPGQIVSIYGIRLGPLEGVIAAFNDSGRLPMSVADASVTWNGIPSPVYFARADQLNVQVPYELASATDAEVIVTVAGNASAARRVRVQPSKPSLYPRVFSREGDVIVLYATGQGITVPASTTGAAATSPYPIPAAPVELQIGGRRAELLFTGQAPGTAGIMQINARIPAGLGAGEADVVLRIGDEQSQPGLRIAVP